LDFIFYYLSFFSSVIYFITTKQAVGAKAIA
jgi:hypothetical protein